MYLKSIELSGFKSFAKKSSLEFNSAISAIVGPNGSGKSNVAEAFRFVLGEQSIKSLRGKRGEDLIFNGAGSEAKSNRASVKVIFDNTQKIFNIDFPEVTIERVVHRDGVNEYLINGSVARLKDVIELLAHAHIGSSGHHIISQGEADRILNASEKERKSMIEDALGLKIYQYKRIESERKLKKTFENIAQVEGLRKEIAPHLKFLRKQAEKIEKTEEIKNELLSLAKEFFKLEGEYIFQNKEALRVEREPVEEKFSKLSRESKEAKQVLDYEANLKSARIGKDTVLREIGRIEGEIRAEERLIEHERKLSSDNDSKTVRLKEVEELYEEVRAISELETILLKIRDFITNWKHATDSTQVSSSEKRIKELKNEKEKQERLLTIATEKEREINEAEKSVLRNLAEEQVLGSKLNDIKNREERLAHEEAEFKRNLGEVGILGGSEITSYKNFKLSGEEKNREDMRRSVERLKIRLEESGISGAGDVLKEFKDVTERDEFLARELLDLDKSALSLKELIKDLEVRLAEEFSQGLNKINTEFGKLFALMFGGGDASLKITKIKKSRVEAVLEEGEDNFDESEEEEVVEEGMDISVNLPRKKIRGLMMLSGGERALTSIALLFAISAVNPPPFIILDETDAALDESNSRKYGDMVESLSKHSQLILITHNRETMSRAGIIYGITMGSTGVSKLLSIAFEEAVEIAK